MARTIFFSDGSHEVLFQDEYDTDGKAEILERILRERLGDDSAALFREIMQDHKDSAVNLMEEMQSYEGSCEAYRYCLQDIQDGLNSASALLEEDRINRKKLSAIITVLKTKIKNEL